MALRLFYSRLFRLRLTFLTSPFFVAWFFKVEHVHFERCSMASRNFDMVFVFKDYDLPPRMVSAVDMKDLDDIQEWLTQQVTTPPPSCSRATWHKNGA
jgi:nucleosome binding factor SPN SPT16 subunit